MRITCLSLLITPYKHLWLHIFIKPNPAESINVLGPLRTCMLGDFSCFYCCRLTFFKINTFKILFQEHYQNAKTVGIQIRTDILPVLI